MADLRQANKFLSLGRRRSNATAAERDTARQKFWDAVDGFADDLMLIGADREAEILRLIAERDAYQAKNAAQRQEIVELRRNRTGQSDDEFEQVLQENGRLRQDYERLRKELRFLLEVPRPPPVPKRF